MFNVNHFKRIVFLPLHPSPEAKSTQSGYIYNGKVVDRLPHDPFSTRFHPARIFFLVALGS